MTAAGTRQRRWIAVGVATLASLLLAALAHAPFATASVRCAHTGPPSNQLRVTPYANPRIDLDSADATVRRSGRRLLVLGGGREGAVRCAGPAPTTSNTKKIVFVLGGLSFGNLDLSGGRPEARTVFHAARGALAYGQIEGTKAPESWTIAGSPRAFGLRLDGSRSGPFDVVLDGRGKKILVAEARGGDDRLDASRVRHRRGLVFLKGGPGDDALIGSRFKDALDGGPGHDSLLAGGGVDQLFARDGFRDRRDVVSACEKSRRRD